MTRHDDYADLHGGRMRVPRSRGAFSGVLLLLVAANRVIASLGGWPAVAGGAWFVVGPTRDRLLHLSSIRSPIRPSTVRSTLESLLLFTGLGAVILFLGALAVGRLGVVGVRDVR